MEKEKPAFRLKYNGVVVIQSLPDNEPQTGKQLYDDTIARWCDKYEHGKYFYNPSSKKELLDVLNEVCNNVLKDDLMPILHFELHGFKKGLELKNKEQILWHEFMDHCRLINIRTNNQLIITLASCWGSEIWRMIDITKPSPYWGYIGPKEEISSGDLMEDFSDFYDSLLTEQNLDNALKKLAFNDRRHKYIYLHAKGIFEHHIEKNYKGTTINKNETFKRLAKQAKEHYPNLNRAERRNRVKTNVNTFNRTSFIYKMKKAFLMT
ncbi:hypothetical protein [Pedobacter hiemivivus]|uniref:Uncharacterized protein n=1 Tax=Pedobacter hiemivivus TaxID=2530454 RepID=A0A4R0NE92_9SPHI|nr:hypothetical protein [Pedobacter hiemivivus]TCC98448.1 hypothetical protein EZ444_03960 [Pedobacter hiemivivus]